MTTEGGEDNIVVGLMEDYILKKSPHAVTPLLATIQAMQIIQLGVDVERMFNTSSFFTHCRSDAYWGTRATS